ncbi:MAG: hypothetical protein IJN62_04160 [Clostridia bacterium]|nr:hypothetical protein [Clostridia bacterium]
MKKLIFVICICVVMLSGCGGKEIDDMAYVVAIGIDATEGGAYDFTFAIGNPNSINGGGGEDAGGGDSNVLIFETETGESIFSAGDAVSARVGQEINFSHAELLVFSEEVAAGGVDNFIDALTRNLNQRPKLIPAVAVTTAKDTLESINSKFEGNPEKYLKKLFESKDALTLAAIDSRDFLCRTKNPDSGLAVPRMSVGDSITVGAMSVFDGDTLAGAFDDVLSYKLLCGMGEDITYDIENSGSLILNQRVKPTVSVSCYDVPKISITVNLDASVASAKPDVAKEDLYSAAELSLKGRIFDLLMFSSADMGVDVFGFDKYARANFLTWGKWQEYNWREKYKTAQFSLSVKIKPEKTGLITGGA